MIWEATISTVIIDKNGNDKILKRAYLLENYGSFGDVEEKLTNEFGTETDFDVCAIKKSKLKEIVNEQPQGDCCKIYFATIVDKFYDADKDETTETKYTVALFAHDISEAHKAIDGYMKQGFEDMELVGLKCTKYLEVL